MGGDHGLSVTIPAVLQAAQKLPDAHFILVGFKDQIEAALRSATVPNASQFEVLHASEVVTMDDSVEVALRRKKDSSMKVAINCIKQGQADACVSAGNTGALMAISRFVLKMLDGIDRPAIATLLPNQKGTGTTVLDLGANVDCSAKNLMEFAIMGSALAQSIDGLSNPSVGLLNVGEEAIKGNETVKQASQLLQRSNLNFIGNVEGDDIFTGKSDVIVCDGFVGNSVLKSIEGVSRLVNNVMKTEFKRNIFSKLLAILSLPVLKNIRGRLDNRRYNGASLLGLRGVVIKSHGSADVLSFACAIERAYEAVSHNLLAKISNSVQHINQMVHADATAANAPEQTSTPVASSHAAPDSIS